MTQHETTMEQPVVETNRRDAIKNHPFRTALAAGAILLSGIGIYAFTGEGDRDSAGADVQGELAAADEACADSWAVVQTNNENSRLVAEGIESIGDAESDEQAREAANEWFSIVKHDPELLAGNANAINGLAGRETNYVAADLYDAESNCFNSQGEQVAGELEFLLASSVITPSEAPADGINTGVDANGEVVQSATPGIEGNREAVLVTLPNGEKFWVMERCGNPVFETPPTNIPEGPTDQPPVTTIPTTPGETVPRKNDDGELPGDGTDASQDPGTPDVAGEGPAGQTPDEDGFIPTETRPSVPATTQTTQGQTTPTTERPTATTSPSPTSTNPPVTATTSSPTTAPQNGTLPPKP